MSPLLFKPPIGVIVADGGLRSSRVVNGNEGPSRNGQEVNMEAAVAALVAPDDLTLVVDSPGFCIISAGKVNRGEDAATQQEAVLLAAIAAALVVVAVVINVRTHNVPSSIDPIGPGVLKAGEINRVVHASVQHVAVEPLSNDVLAHDRTPGVNPVC